MTIPHPTASLATNLGIGVLAVLVAGLLTRGNAWATERLGRGHPGSFGLRLAIWLAFTGTLAASGVLRNYALRPSPMLLLLIAGVLGAVWLAGSALGERLAEGLPLAAILGFQAFRLPLELVLHHAATEGTMPVQMSFSGYNFDIVSGTGAIVMAWLAARGQAPRSLVTAWALLTSLLLAVIVAIAVASTPIVAAFGNSPRELNTWIGWFPFIWLPTVLVPSALFGQIVLFRRLALGSID